MGTYEGQEVVACQSFLHEGEQFVPFNDVGESTLDRDKETYQYEYADIMQMLRDNSKLTDVEETVSRFWELFIVDALIGNFDRHGGNWGFIKQDGKYRLAPIFDNGSSLFPNMVDEDEMLAVMGSEQETAKRVYGFPTSQIRLNGRKSSYFDVIDSLQFPECNRALRTVVERADLVAILGLVDAVPGLGPVPRGFYRHMLSRRFEAILLAPYKKLGGMR